MREPARPRGTRPDSQEAFLNTAESFIKLVEKAQKTTKIPLMTKFLLWLLKWKLRPFRRFCEGK